MPKLALPKIFSCRRLPSTLARERPAASWGAFPRSQNGVLSGNGEYRTLSARNLRPEHSEETVKRVFFKTPARIFPANIFGSNGSATLMPEPPVRKGNTAPTGFGQLYLFATPRVPVEQRNRFRSWWLTSPRTESRDRFCWCRQFARRTNRRRLPAEWRCWAGCPFSTQARRRRY